MKPSNIFEFAKLFAMLAVAGTWACILLLAEKDLGDEMG